MSLVRGIHAGSKTLLAHFHFICKGQKPFDIDWGSGRVPTAVYRMAKVTVVQAKFLCLLVSHIRQKRKSDAFSPNQVVSNLIFLS
jgi:hypothetical protein